MAVKKRGLGAGLDNLIPNMGLDMIEEEMKESGNDLIPVMIILIVVAAAAGIIFVKKNKK